MTPSVTIDGPDGPSGSFVGDDWVDGPDFVSAGTTVRECLQPYLDQFGSAVELYGGENGVFPEGEEPRYFWYISADLGRMLVDIHIERAGEDVCIKQNLDVPVVDGDRIRIGLLVC